mgnify:CR=1 FL=1
MEKIGGDGLTTLSPLSTAPRARLARISFPLVLALALIFMLVAWAAVPTKAEVIPPLAVSVSLDKTTVAVGETVTATWTFSGGRAPYSIQYFWYVVSGGSLVLKEQGNTPSGVTTSSFSPPFGEECYVSAYINDADGRFKSLASTRIPVTGSEPVSTFAVAVSLDKTTVAVGQTVTATWTFSGGRAPYSIQYFWYVVSGGSLVLKEQGNTPSGVTTSSFSPPFGEECYVSAYINDADGRFKSLASTRIPVTGSEPVSTFAVAVSLDKTTVAVGQTVTATWTFSGGRAPYSIQYFWYVVSGGSLVLKEQGNTPSGVTTSSFSPPFGEECYVSAYINDADGRFKSLASTRIPIYVAFAENIALDASSITIDIGKEKHLTATISPANCSIKTLSWSSSDSSIATVSSTGLVTAVGEGTATITAATTDGSGLSATCDVTVNPPIPVTTVTIDEPEAALYAGGKIKLTATVLPENATYKTLSWTSSDSSVATVADGVVTGVAKGTATITATATNGVKAERSVTISSTASRLRAFAYGMGMQFSYYTSIIFKVGAQYGTPPYTVDMALTRDGTVLYSGSLTTNGSKDVAVPVGSIPAGTYTATAIVTDYKGRVDTASTSCYMYASGWNMGVSLYDEVRPITAVTGISFQNADQSVSIGRTLTLSPAVSPSNAPTPSYEWTSGNPAAVTVSNSGVVTGVGKGSSVVTASATDGSGLSASCTVTAYRDVDSVSLNRTELKLTQSETATLTAMVLPADADYRTVTWSSSDSSIASVNGGVVTGLKDGTAVIAASSSNGKYASCSVTVSNRIESVNVTLPENPPLVRAMSLR